MADIDKEIEVNIQALAKIGLQEKKIVLFGAGYYSRRLFRILEEYGYSVFAVIDNKKSLDNCQMKGCRVWYTDRFLEKFDSNYIFLILSNYYNSMKNQLEQYGYVENIHIFRMAELDNGDIWHVIDDNRMDEIAEEIVRGRKLHEQILDKYGNNIKIIIQPSSSVGDVYLPGFYVKKYLESHRDVLFIFIGRTLAELAIALGFGQVMYMKDENVWELISYAKVCGLNKVNIELLHTLHGSHFRIWAKLLICAGFTWMEHYRELFELPMDTEPDVQNISAKNNVHAIFERSGLAEGKTVILAPYAKSMCLLSDKFWELLAEKLKMDGYCVCTNVGSKDEHAVKGTIPIYVEINDIQEFAQRAGYFISLRSGLCDILCNSCCKKIILYCSNVHIYSLISMGFTKNMSEYEVDRENEHEVLSKILEEMKG